MSTIVSLHSDKNQSATHKMCKGLMGVIRYDPHLQRCFEAIKYDLAAGIPSLIRLHSAADYPNSPEDRYDIDQEGQAVLIVGYDEAVNQYAIIDPYLRHKDSAPTAKWVDFDELEIRVVDCSRGAAMPLTTLKTNAEISKDNALIIQLGFPPLRGSFMDHDSMVLEKIYAKVGMKSEQWSREVSVSSSDICYVGQCATFKIPLDIAVLNQSLSVAIDGLAVLKGIRPYKYSDEIGIKHYQILDVGQISSRLCAVNA